MNKDKLVIHGVTINKNSQDIINAKSISDIQKLDIFSHLSLENKDDAEAKLLDFCLKKEDKEENNED